MWVWYPPRSPASRARVGERRTRRSPATSELGDRRVRRRGGSWSASSAASCPAVRRRRGAVRRDVAVIGRPPERSRRSGGRAGDQRVDRVRDMSSAEHRPVAERGRDETEPRERLRSLARRSRSAGRTRSCSPIGMSCTSPWSTREPRLAEQRELAADELIGLDAARRLTRATARPSCSASRTRRACRSCRRRIAREDERGEDAALSTRRERSLRARTPGAVSAGDLAS